MRRRRLINAETFETTEAFAVSDKVPTISVVKCYSAAQDLERLIDERPGITCPTFSNATPKHGVEHHILTEGAPVFARTRRSSVDFLGHHVNAKGIVPLPEKVRVIRDFPRPSTVRGLQEFLGMIHFYHRFVPHVAEILVPMHAALAGRKRLASLVWTPEMENAFTASKNALADATLLIHPVEDAPTSLTVDASIVAIGGVLEQRTNGVWLPLGFFSRKLQIPRETKYSTFDRELLAAHFAIRHFRYFLEGRHFTLYTDQDSLVPALRKTADSWTSRQQNQLSAISEYTTDVRHIAGKDNQVADALSRITIDAVELAQGVDYHAMALAQDSDDDIIHLRNDPATSLRLENVRQLHDVTFVRYIHGCSTPRCPGAVSASRFRYGPRTLASWNSHDTTSSHIEVRLASYRCRCCLLGAGLRSMPTI